MSHYIHRTLQSSLARAVADFPVVVLTGPRQSGKTTMVKHCLGDHYDYVSLDAPDVREAAAGDPRGFLALHKPPLVIDEIQHVPELLSYIKENVDANRQSKGGYVLIGSQNLLLLSRVSETLAGRAAVLRLMPLTMREQAGDPGRGLPWDTDCAAGCTAPIRLLPLWDGLVRGSYPELTREPARDAVAWQASYVQTYLERDVRDVRQVGDLGSFQAFVRALAARSGQLLNLSDVARDIGVSHGTARAWLSVLEATFQVVILRPYHANIGKRLIKTPKLYFSDTGVLCYLLGMTRPELAMGGPLRGQLFETLVVAEIYKTMLHAGSAPRMYFWRTATGVEVDLLIETPAGLVPVETRASATPRSAMASAIHALRQDLGAVVLPGYVIHAGDVSLPMGDRTVALPYSLL
ncbi:MAG: ATP-binding protein [Bacillota bacterium]|nr:ATP-binding protein [Bacillota bacterium]